MSIKKEYFYFRVFKAMIFLSCRSIEDLSYLDEIISFKYFITKKIPLQTNINYHKLCNMIKNERYR